MRLVHALIAKSIAETVLVAALAVGFYIYAFPPSYNGWSEVTTHSISGWVVNQIDPWERIQVQLFIDGNFVASASAIQSRPDVVSAGWAKDEWHGYTFAAPPLAQGAHIARVYAVHASGGEVRQTLQLVGDPIYLQVDNQGSLSELTKTNTYRTK